MKKTMWWMAAVGFALVAMVWVGDAPATTDAAAMTSMSTAVWAPDLGPVGSLQVPTTSITEECMFCLQDCMATTGYDATVCRNSYCVAECC